MTNVSNILVDNNVVELACTPRPQDKKRIYVYLTDKGSSPVKDWMKDMCGCNDMEKASTTDEARKGKKLMVSKLCYYLRERIAPWLLPTIPVHYRRLASIDCYEIKHGAGRVIGFYDLDMFIAVHAFEKKTSGKTPQRHLQTASDRKKDYISRKEKLLAR